MHTNTAGYSPYQHIGVPVGCPVSVLGKTGHQSMIRHHLEPKTGHYFCLISLLCFLLKTKCFTKQTWTSKKRTLLDYQKLEYKLFLIDSAAVDLFSKYCTYSNCLYTHPLTWSLSESEFPFEVCVLKSCISTTLLHSCRTRPLKWFTRTKDSVGLIVK